MDNASNCDSTATRLGAILPAFRGALSRTRCFPHTVNLVAKAFISFFFRQFKCKKAVKVVPGKHRRGAPEPAATDVAPLNDRSDATQPEREVQDRADGEGDPIDEGKEAHDEEAVRGVRARAIETFKNNFGVEITNEEEKEALGIFPKDLHVGVTTAPLYKKKTNLFSQKEVPLIYEVIPMLEEMEHQLTNVRNSYDMPKVIRIAAQAALFVIEKYYALTDDNEVYRIAIGKSFTMCPDKKLVWFEKNPDWRTQDCLKATQVLRTRWTETYAPLSSLATARESEARQATGPPKARSRWASSFRSTDAVAAAVDPDTLDVYLAAAPIPKADIDQSKGSRPRLSRMALDFLTAPTSSVDAERAFSVGRLQVNHLQHNMSSQSFKAQMALGAWAGGPLLPDLDLPTRVISEVIGNSKGKGKAVEDDVMIID
ncbi:hypothetical protein HWV62_26741 [Athelia sp. TMB]|nr:hypothetical protein HWV62_26741 [Athelia sp. TMB]